MLEPNNPCKPDCPERSPTCHSECEKYIAYDILRDIYRNQIYRDKELKYDILMTSRHAKKQKRRRCYADNRHGQ